ncbi:hypothetical protein Tco_0905004 [Tanacetum coccineum]
MTEPSWIDAMQEEIHKCKRIQVWELVPFLDKVLLIKLKWIYKVKTDEFGGVLKNKAKRISLTSCSRTDSDKKRISDFEESYYNWLPEIEAIYIYAKPTPEKALIKAVNRSFDTLRKTINMGLWTLNVVHREASVLRLINLLVMGPSKKQKSHCITEYKGTCKDGDGVYLTGDEDPTDEDGDNDMGDPTGGSGSNSGDGGNTRDEGKTVGGAIGARGGGIGDLLLVALYACMTFIYGSSWKGEMVSEAE